MVIDHILHVVLSLRCSLDLLGPGSELADVKGAYLVTEGVLCLTNLVDSIGILVASASSEEPEKYLYLLFQPLEAHPGQL